MNSTALHRKAEQIKAAVDLVMTAHGHTSWEQRDQVFDVLTNFDDADRPVGLLVRLLARYPPASFDLAQLPVQSIPNNPSLN